MSLPTPLEQPSPTRAMAADRGLPGDGTAPRALRSWLATLLDERQSRLVGADLAVIASELATNAARHGLAPIRAGVRVTETPDGNLRIRLEVADSGSGFTPGENVSDLDGYPSLDCHGRGLLIVAELSHRWGTELHDDHHLVWAELRTPGDPSETDPTAPIG